MPLTAKASSILEINPSINRSDRSKGPLVAIVSSILEITQSIINRSDRSKGPLVAICSVKYSRYYSINHQQKSINHHQTFHGHFRFTI